MNSSLKLILTCSLALYFVPGWCNITLPALVSSDMVLQQNSEIRLWGWGEPLEKVEILTSWNGEVISTVTDSHANWSIQVMTPEAGGPYEIKISGYNQILLNNVMIGEVWICSGQSNMQWPLSGGVNRGEEEIASADLPDIRLFQVVRKSSEAEQIDLHGKWQVCRPEIAKDFSAVGYFFAKQLQQNLKIPVGIINSSWGGTPAEAWIPAKYFVANDSLREASEKLEPNPWGPQKPALVYNTMIHPLRSIQIAGVIWYQGEANVINANYYEHVFSQLIASWRDIWKQEFPFYYVQIAPFAYGQPEEGVLVREAQRRVMQQVRNTGMVVISDIADLEDIHPKEKLEVGNRLARMILKKHYKTLDELVESPMLSTVEIQKNKVYVEFDHCQGLYFEPNSESLFELAGADGIFFPAKARIRDERVLLVSPEVKAPVYVRFAWGNASVSNLFNEAGLPASSFSTLSP
jgi:sialate O-acetylesterase